MSEKRDASSPESHGYTPGTGRSRLACDATTNDSTRPNGRLCFRGGLSVYLLADTTTNLSVLSIASQSFCNKSLEKYNCLFVLLPYV